MLKEIRAKEYAFEGQDFNQTVQVLRKKPAPGMLDVWFGGKVSGSLVIHIHEPFCEAVKKVIAINDEMVKKKLIPNSDYYNSLIPADFFKLEPFVLPSNFTKQAYTELCKWLRGRRQNILDWLWNDREKLTPYKSGSQRRYYYSEDPATKQKYTRHIIGSVRFELVDTDFSISGDGEMLRIYVPRYKTTALGKIIIDDPIGEYWDTISKYLSDNGVLLFFERGRSNNNYQTYEAVVYRPL